MKLPKADQILERFERQRDLSRTIVHVDMDAFYAAVEMLDRPELRDQPMAVGGNYMLSTSNYAARRYGVRAAMPGFIARKLCPELVIIPLNFDKYTAASEQVKTVFAIYDPNYSSASLDEAYLDITDHLTWRQNSSDEQRMFSGFARPDLVCRCSGSSSSDKVGAKCSSCGKVVETPTVETFGVSPEEAVREMRFRIYQKTCLTASAGIAANTMIAKVCSDRNKPNGQFAVESKVDAIRDFIHDLPIRKICGIGKVTEKMLAALGIVTCHQLYEKRDILYHLYSTISFEYFMAVALGIGSTRVERDAERKSMSVERTFGEMSDPVDLHKMCRSLSESLANDLREESLVGKTVTLKIKTVTFEVYTRAQTLTRHTNDVKQISAAACKLLQTQIDGCSPQPLQLRLLGVRMSALQHEDSMSESIISMLCRQSQNTTFDEDKISLPDIEVNRTVAGVSNCSNVIDDCTQQTADGSEFPKCPLCGRCLSELHGDEVLINRHIDECLNKSAVVELLSNDKQLAANNRCSAVSTSTSLTKTSKRRKLEGNTTSSIEKYFKK